MAAASLTGAFTELGERFEDSHPAVQVRLNFAGSQQLAYQIAQGAPADVFASANQPEMDGLLELGLIDRASVQVFAYNRLAVIYPSANPAAVSQLEDLAKPGLKLVLATKETPVGAYSLEFIRKLAAAEGTSAGFMEAVLDNVVSYETNVRAVAAKVSLGEADAGIVYTSDVVIARRAGEDLKFLEIPEALNVKAAYPVGVTAASEASLLASEFIQLLLSAEGQALLEEYGFTTAAP